MPRGKRTYYRRKKRFAKKRRYGKKYPVSGTSKKGVVSLTIRRPSIIPDRLFVRLKYTRIGYNFNAGTVSNHIVFRGNSPYDPEQALGGHSCMGYDQWATLYSNYRVHKSMIAIRIAQIDNPCRMTITPSTLISLPASIVVASEMPYTKMSTWSTSLALKPVVKNSMYTKKVFGLKSIAYEDGFSSEVNNVPTDQWYWVVNISSANGVSNLSSFFDVLIIYNVEFFNRVELSQSGVETQPFGQVGPTGAIGEGTGGATGAPGNIYDDAPLFDPDYEP